MLASSSPTVSTPSSPSVSFHSRAYHASRRPSHSPGAASPRFQVSGPARRFDVPSTASPVLAHARSPCVHKASYVDAATQYTPPGLPPTSRSAPPEPAPAPAPVPAPAPASASVQGFTPHLPGPLAQGERRATSAAAAVVTESPEPAPRIPPQPVASAPDAGPGSTRSREADRAVQEQRRPQQRTGVSQAGVQSSSPVRSAPAKRPRSLNQSVKVMPLKYETCDVKDLGVLISDMLMELVRLNDSMPLRDGQLTRFHSRAPPAISVKDYLFRLIVHATLSPPILLSMVFYVDKLCTMYPSFTISSLTVHRFLITAATVAAKGLSDSFWTNSLYAKVGGVSLRELALLELEFLRKLEWRIVPKPETLVDYYKGLVERGDGHVLEKDAQPEPAATPSTSVAAAPPSEDALPNPADPASDQR